jgi:hypothetical protein
MLGWRCVFRFGPVVTCLLILLPVASFAQDPDPQPPPLREEAIGLFVLDARGVMASLKPSNAIAANVGLTAATELPGRGFGFSVGAHVYPVRGRRFALGVGADLLLRARGSRTQPAASATAPEGPTVVTRMTAVAPQVSLNFGKRNGWSYVSAGMGPASIVTELDDDPFPDADTNPRAINYGGGARWFAKKHLAFTFDVRFYAVRPQEATTTRPAYPRMTVTVLSAGISVR